MNRSKQPLVLSSLILAACATPTMSDGGSTDEFVTDEQTAPDNTASDPAPARDPNDAFYANHPRTGKFTLSNGQVMEVPWRAQDIDYWAVYATADAKVMDQLMARTGYKPWTTEVDGKRRGVVRLHSLNYRDSDNGPYKAFLITLDAYKDDGGAARTFPWVNPYSVLVPVSSGDLLFFFRGVVTGDHMTTGRELLGYDKRKGSVSIFSETEVSGPQLRLTHVKDETGQPVVSAKFVANGAASTQLAEANEFAHALGLADATQLPAPAAEIIQDGASPDPVRPGKIKTYNGAGTWRPSMGRWNGDDTLSFDARSEFGRIATSLDIKPEVVMHDNHAKMSLTPDLTP